MPAGSHGGAQGSSREQRQLLPSSRRGPCGCSGCGRPGWRGGARASQRPGAAAPACEPRRAGRQKTRNGHFQEFLGFTSLELLGEEGHSRSHAIPSASLASILWHSKWRLISALWKTYYKQIWSIPQLINTVQTLYFNLKSTSKHAPAQTSLKTLPHQPLRILFMKDQILHFSLKAL